MELNYETIGVIIAFLIHTGGIIWWAATLSGKVSLLEADLMAVKNDQRDQEKSLASMSSLLARMDERTAAMMTTMERVEKRLDGSVAS